MADAATEGLHPCCRVLELRQYSLRPTGRDTLVELFSRYFVDALEAAGMHVPGLFADVDDPDRLVWLRGFPDMEGRHQALSDFYLDGAVWREHGRAANATMVDSDDVLLLQPVYLGPRYPLPASPRTCAPAPDVGGGLLVVDVRARSRLDDADPDSLVDLLRAASDAHGAELLLVAVTHPEPNDFPALPVRDEQVVVWIMRYPDVAAREQVEAQLDVRLDDEQVRLRAVPGSQITTGARFEARAEPPVE
jgi:hypothetical protein